MLPILKKKKKVFYKAIDVGLFGESCKNNTYGRAHMFLRCYNTFKFADFLELLNLFLSKPNVSGIRIFAEKWPNLTTCGDVRNFKI